jgi:hypothetical protein
LALIEYSREQFMKAEELMDCLQIAMKPLDFESADEVIELAERVRKIMNPERHPIPIVVEREVSYMSFHGTSERSVADLSFAFDDAESSQRV